MDHTKQNLRSILHAVIGNEDKYCEGFLSNPVNSPSYILGINLSVAKVKKQLSHSGSQLLDEINSFDRAEVTGANIGQINMITVSSFCGPRGLVWGLDIAKPLALGKKSDFFSRKDEKTFGIEIYDISPIKKAFESLVGSVCNPRFPFLPGSHVPCANKSIKKEGPSHIYTSIALAVPDDRKKSALLMMEDVGEIPLHTLDLDAYRRKILLNSVKSVLQIGLNQNVTYNSVYIGLNDILLKEREIGCALVASPYFLLPKKILPNKNYESLSDLSLEDWASISKNNWTN